MKFEAYEGGTLLHCEGRILYIAHGTGEEEGYYFSAFIQDSSDRLYIKVVPITIQLYVLGFLTLRDVCSLSISNNYYVGSDDINKSCCYNESLSDLIDNIPNVDTYYLDIQFELKPEAAFSNGLEISDELQGLEISKSCKTH